MSLIDKWREYWELAPPRKLEKWSKHPIAPPPGKNHDMAKFVIESRRTTGNYPDEKFILNHIMEIGVEKTSVNLAINDPVTENCSLDFFEAENSKLEPKDMDLSLPHFNSLHFKKPLRGLVIRGAIISVLNIDHNVNELIMENCCIGRINFSSTQTSTKIKNSWIGVFHLSQNNFINLLIEGGWICLIDCPPSHEPSPFRGSVDLKDVKLPTSQKKSLIFQGPQQYRNLRSHLEKLQNGPMVSLMRAKELASERETDSGLSYVFNWIYFLASNYGRYPGRAFLWSILFLVLNFAFLFWFDGGKINPNIAASQDWQQSYIENNDISKMVRSAFLTFQTVINPFGIVFSKSAFQFHTLCGLIHTFIMVIFADAAFIFGSLAIRKRLKVS